MRSYDELQGRIQWEISLGEPELPGLRSYAAAVTIPGRKDQQVLTLPEDRVSNVAFTLPRQHEPHVGDRLDGAEVLEVGSIKDVQGTVIRWVAYAKS